MIKDPFSHSFIIWHLFPIFFFTLKKATFFFSLTCIHFYENENIEKLYLVFVFKFGFWNIENKNRVQKT